MVDKINTLQEMLSDASLLGQLGKEDGIDYNKQLDDIIRDMTLAVPSNTFSDKSVLGSVSCILDDSSFKDLIDATYQTAKDQIDLLSNLTGQSNPKKKKIFNQYLQDWSKEVGKPFDELVRDFLSDVIYDHSKFCEELSPVLPRKLIKDVQFTKDLGDYGSPHVDFNIDKSAMVHIQNKLLGELIKKNSKYRKSSLLLDEDLLCAPSFSQMIPDLYGDSQDVLIGDSDKVNRMQQSRFRFSLLTAHVGVYHKKQRGKLKYVIENLLNIPLDGSANCNSPQMMNILESIKRDLDSSQDVPKGIQSEVRLKLMQGYAGLHSKLDGSESTIDQLKSQAQKAVKLEGDYQTATSQINELSDKISLLEAQQKTLAGTVEERVTQDYESRLQELKGYKSKVQKLSHQLDYFKGKADERGVELTQINEDVESYKASLKIADEMIDDLEQDLIISNNDSKHDVDIYANIELRAKGQYKDIYERAVDILSRQPSHGRFVQGNVGGRLHDTLSKHFPECIDQGYRILNAKGGHRVIYSIKPNDDSVIMLIMPHDEYDKWCDGKK